MRRAPWSVVLLAALGSCEMFAYADRSKIPDAPGGASSTGGAATGGTGGEPGSPCVQVNDCPRTDTECRSRTCVGGHCGVKDAPRGKPTAAQVAGDCKQVVCDGAGSTTVVDDGADPFDDGNPCTVDQCAAGAPENLHADAGGPCSGPAGGTVCDGAGHCVACISSAQCTAQKVCVLDRCVPAECTDHKQDGNETAVDCGGPDCAPCADGATCKKPGDCLDGVCTGGQCQPPSCSDGVKNGAETGVDCGGGCPTPCGYGQGCNVDADCLGQRCSGAVCLATCDDGVKNGGETGVDCGGSTCAPCSTGNTCNQDGDCYEGACVAGVCLPASCADRVKDGSESDVDCGGGLCPACPAGKACSSGLDCTSRVCAASRCGAPSCADHTRNGNETGVDCGGPTCPACPAGQTCLSAADCQSGLCISGLCVSASCTDGMKDGTETGVDCGGGCPGCPGGTPCLAGTDCASTVCASGQCTTPTCSDKIQNGTETGVDCGGGCPGCALGQPCLVPGDCVSLACVGGACTTPTCADGEADGHETDIDCGGPDCAPCGDGQACLADADCQSAGCFGGACGDKMVISQVRTNGPNPDYFGDDFVEIYNPGSLPVTLDASWEIWHRSAQGTCQGDELRFQGSGQVIPPHHYFLMVGLSYAGPPGDIVFLNTSVLTSIADAASLRIVHKTQVVDALCYGYDATTLGRLEGSCPFSYVCEGTPVSNLPHDGTTDPTSSVDAALERKPGGALGDQQDTGDSAADFQMIMPSHPRNAASPPAP